MNTVSRAHFSRMCQVSREAIGKAIKTDRVKTIIDGGKNVVDLSHRVTQEYLREKNPKYKKPSEPVKKVEPKSEPEKEYELPPAKPEKKPKIKKTAPAKKKVPPIDPELKITATVEPEDSTPVVVARSIDEVDDNNISYVEKSDLQKFKLYEETLRIKQEREFKRGEIIPRTMVRRIFAKLYSIHINEFKTMEDRLAPDICAIFGVQDSSPEAVKVRQLLNTDQGKTLKSIQRLFSDFLVKIGAGGL